MTNSNLNITGILKSINIIINIYSSGRYEFIHKNSSEFLRRILNSQISSLLGVEINDSFNIYKTNQRALYYFELRILVFLRSSSFNFDDFSVVVSEISNNYNSSQYFHKVDLQLLEVLPSFKSHVKDPVNVDKLIKVHQYVSGLWKNGSKFLHFYTLHNEEHSVELIKQCIKIKNTIDYLKLKTDDYYILFLACYLHDISMALHPNLEMFSNDNLDSELLYSEWKRDIYDLLEIDYKPDSKKTNIIRLENVNKSDIKNLMLSYFTKIDEFFERNIRDNHAAQSAKFIKEQQELKFIDNAFLQLVADISVAHNYDAKNIYKVKSSAKSDLFDTKYLMIILRLADLLDMSRERISTKFLKQNMKYMSQYSKYHWVSHMSINHCHIESDFSPNEKDEDGNISINELITVKVNLNTSQLSRVDKANCSNWYSRFAKDNKTIEIYIKDNNELSNNTCENCSVSCKWFVDKQWWLFNELYELQRYLGRNNSNIFKTSFKVELVFDNTDTLPQEYLDIVLENIS
jgi:hypothetical protein